MDFLGSSLTSPSVPCDPVAPLRLTKKRGPASSDRQEPALGEPLLEDGLSSEDAGVAISLLGRVRRFAALCLWPEGGSDELLVPAAETPGVFSRLMTTLRRGVRSCCETVINGFIWSAQATPF